MVSQHEQPQTGSSIRPGRRALTRRANFLRTIVFAALALLSVGISAHANAVIIVDITTTPTSVTYSINNQPMTAAKLAEWMKNAIEQFGDKEPILIQPDARTTFATVFALLDSLKASGVKHFEIITERSPTPSGVERRSLVTNADQIKREKF
jgi:hypothetical protein